MEINHIRCLENDYHQRELIEDDDNSTNIQPMEYFIDLKIVCRGKQQ